MTGPSVERQDRIGPILLAPGIPVREVIIFLLIAAVANALVSFSGVMQPFVLTAIARVPAHEQGRVSGLLSTVQQIAVMCFVGIGGAMGDRVGRKLLIVAVLIGFGLCMGLFAVAASVVALVAVRALFGVGYALFTASAPPKFFDYADNRSRGKFMALTMVLFNLSGIVLVGLIGSRLPHAFARLGWSELRAGQLALLAAMAVALAAALAAAALMMPDRHLGGVRPRHGAGMWSGFAELFRHARRRPGFGVLLLTSFVIRTDSAVLQSFLSLWIVNAGRESGVGMLDALKVVGTLAAIQSVTSIVVPLILGVILDRANRVAIYLGSIGLVGAALLPTPLVTEVTGWTVYAVVAAIGVSEAAQVIAQQALFGQEAPEHLRGTAYGILAVFGTVSVVAVSIVGGVLFDRVGYTAPFLLSGWLHLGVLAVALAVLGGRKLTAARA